MSTDLTTRPAGSTDLTIEAGQTFWTDKQIAALRQLGVQNANNGDLAVFYHQVARTGLDPFARQIYMIERQGKQTIQTGIDGFRLIARRAVDRSRGTLGFLPTEWCGADGQWRDVWLSGEHPAAARVTVLRDGQPYPAVAMWGEYAGTKRDGGLTAMWAGKPALMLAKCAEALALRRAFPQDLSGIYTSDEMSANVVEAPVESSVNRLRAALAPTHSEAEDVQDAEVVEPEQPTLDVAPAEPEPLTDRTRGQMFAVLAEHGIVEPERQRAGMSAILGRKVASRSELTEADALLVIADLRARA